MNKTLSVIAALCCAFSILLTGCESDDDDVDFGDNDPNLVACVGDSIMAGYNCIGSPFSTRLAAKSGKNVLNFAQPGAVSSYGVSIIDGVLARKPGYVCIMLGSNDAIQNKDLQSTKANIAAIIAACKSNNSVPIVGTPPRTAYGHLIFNDRTKRVSQVVREAASEQGAKLVDINSAFGDEPEIYLNPADGLHLSEEGGELLADQFNGAL